MEIIIARTVVLTFVGSVIGLILFLAIRNSYLTRKYFISERAYRVRCRKCDQLFNLMCLSYNEKCEWYESQGHINNPHCRCHDLVGHDRSEMNYIKELRECQNQLK